MAMENKSLSIRQVIGSSILSNIFWSKNPLQDKLYFVTGSTISTLSYKRNERIKKNTSKFISNKSISCVAMSQGGTYLAYGEKGKDPVCCIIDLKTNKQICVLGPLHKHGIGCIEFIPDSQLIITAGFKYDKSLVIWNMHTQQPVSVQRVSNKIHAIACHSSGTFFVTSGDRHLKFWDITILANNEANAISDSESKGNADIFASTVEVVGKPASILEAHSRSVFTSICFGEMKYKNTMYCATSQGIVCQVSSESRSVENYTKLVGVETVHCIHWVSVPAVDSAEYEHRLVVGCSDGSVRLVCPDTLETLHILNCPSSFPGIKCYALSRISASQSTTESVDELKEQFLVSSYSDKHIAFWNLQELCQTLPSVTAPSVPVEVRDAHSACIWDIAFLSGGGSHNNDSATMTTCSADDTIRFWSLAGTEGNSNLSAGSLGVLQLSSNADTSSHSSIGDSLQYTKISASILLPSESVYSATSATNATSYADGAMAATAMLDTESSDTASQTHSCPRVLALHPSLPHLVCGTRSGALLVFGLPSNANYSIEVTIPLLNTLQVHASEILAVQFSPWNVKSDNAMESKRPILMVSGGRDRAIHVHDASTEQYSLVATLDTHSSSVVALQFTSDGNTLVSCGADQTMNIFAVNGTDIQLTKSIQTPHTTLSGLSIESTNRFAVTCGRDSRLHIWNLRKGGKLMRSYKCPGAEFYKTDVDPSGMYIAACGFDTIVRIVDFFSGDVVCASHGHSDLITNIKFAPDGKSIVSVGADGCIFVWQLPERVVTSMRERLNEMSAVDQEIPKVSSVWRFVSESSAASDCNFETSNVGHMKSIDVSSVQKDQSSEDPLKAPSVVGEVVSTAIEQLQATELAVVGSKLGARKKLVTKKPRTADLQRQVAQHSAAVSTITVPPPVSIWGNHSLDGYELFGHRIKPTLVQSNDLNKFTLERTEASQSEEDTAAAQATDNDIIDSIGITTLSARENEDTSDDENLFSELSQANDPTLRTDDYVNAGIEELQDLSRTTSESKLEVLVQQDLQPTGLDKTKTSNHTRKRILEEETVDDNLADESEDCDIATDADGHKLSGQQEQPLLIPNATPYQDSIPSEQLSPELGKSSRRDEKCRVTVAAVADMKSRLHHMGILAPPSEAPQASAEPSLRCGLSIETALEPAPCISSSAMEAMCQVSATTDSNARLQIQSENFKRTLSTFEQMQTALLAEYQALLASRRVNLGVTSSSGSTQQLDNESTDRSNLQGSNEVDMLLLQFHQSVQRLSRSVDSSMSQLDTRCITSTFSSEFLSKTQGDFDADPSDLKALCLELDRSKESDTVCDELNGVGSTASLADHLSEASVSHVLEKYSDRLVELVTEKLKLSK